MRLSVKKKMMCWYFAMSPAVHAIDYKMQQENEGHIKLIYWQIWCLVSPVCFKTWASLMWSHYIKRNGIIIQYRKLSSTNKERKLLSLHPGQNWSNIPQLMSHLFFLSTIAPSCLELLMLREICHSLPACCQSSCSHRCCCWQRSPWPSGGWALAEFLFDSVSRQSQHGRASGCLYRSTPGPYWHSRSTGSSKRSRAGLRRCYKKKKNVITFLLTTHRKRE